MFCYGCIVHCFELQDRHTRNFHDCHPYTVYRGFVKIFVQWILNIVYWCLAELYVSVHAMSFVFFLFTDLSAKTMGSCMRTTSYRLAWSLNIGRTWLESEFSTATRLHSASQTSLQTSAALATSLLISFYLHCCVGAAWRWGFVGGVCMNLPIKADVDAAVLHMVGFHWTPLRSEVLSTPIQTLRWWNT